MPQERAVVSNRASGTSRRYSVNVIMEVNRLALLASLHQEVERAKDDHHHRDYRYPVKFHLGLILVSTL
jgi:hypothetical protein